MSVRICIACNRSKPGIVNVRGDVYFEPKIWANPKYQNLPKDSDLFLCQKCIQELIKANADNSQELFELDPQEEVQFDFVSNSAGTENVQPQSQSTIAQLVLSSQNVASQLNPELDTIENRIEGLVRSPDSDNSSKRKSDGDDPQVPTNPSKRFKSNELTELFSKPMPFKKRQQRFRQIQNLITDDDLRDREVFRVYMSIKEQDAEARKNQQRTNRSDSSISLVDDESTASSLMNSMNQPLTQTSPPITPQVPRTTDARIVPMPDNDDSSTNASSDRNVPQLTAGIGNTHSNGAAPRRVRDLPNSRFGTKNQGG